MERVTREFRVAKLKLDAWPFRRTPENLGAKLSLGISMDSFGFMWIHSTYTVSKSKPYSILDTRTYYIFEQLHECKITLLCLVFFF